MFEAFIDGLLIVLQWKLFSYLVIGSLIGFFVGILPGLGGGATLALMLPFIYHMTPSEGLAFLLGMHSVCATTGDITSILFGVPGEATAVAVIVDGYPMSKKGEAGRALGASLMSSLIGSLLGAGVLALSVPLVQPLVLSLGSPEMFMLVILGLTCISSLSAQGMRGFLLGVLCAGFGFLCSLVGQDQLLGIQRFTFGQIFLWNGIPLVPVMVGLFAIPEVVDLVVRGTAIAGDVPHGKLGKGVMEGIKDTFRHFWLVVRCGIIGCIIGILPGLGGGVAQWIAYAHATQNAKTQAEREGFGKGDVRGVLGPGSACASKEGGSLIPTVAFGIPGSSSMAILLAAFFLLGLVPGPEMLTKHLTITFSMAWTIVVANVIVVAISLLFINRIARMTTIRGGILVPFILVLCFIGAYTSDNHAGDLVVVFVSGVLGYFMVLYGWPRPPFILGFVLGKLAEQYLYSATDRYGTEWLARPKVIFIFILAVIAAIYPFIQNMRLKRKETAYAHHR